MGSERYRSVYHYSRSSSGSIYPRLTGQRLPMGAVRAHVRCRKMPSPHLTAGNNEMQIAAAVDADSLYAVPSVIQIRLNRS